MAGNPIHTQRAAGSVSADGGVTAHPVADVVRNL